MPRTSFLRRTCLVAATAAALGLTGAPAGVAQPAQQAEQKSRCAKRNLEPAPGNLTAIRRATLCLLNRERTSRGLGKLRANRTLRVVASRYARSMVRHQFFGHVSPTGTTFVQRIKRSAYTKGAKRYWLGENLAWGGGALATPRQIVRTWMRSAGHRANILNGRFRDIGVGVAIGVPVAGGGEGATYATPLAARRR